MSLRKRAEEYFRQNNLAEAKKLYTRIYETNRNDIEALFMLGAINGQQNSLVESESCFREIVKRIPGHFSAWDNLGVYLMLQGKDSDAESCFRKAIQIRPDRAQSYNNLGNLLKNRGSNPEAISCYQRALQINPEYSEAWNNLATVYFDQDRIPEAVESYRKALQINPNYPNACINLGNALHKLNRHAEAIDCFQRALKIQPDNIEVHKYLGALYWETHRKNDAIASISRVLAISPGDISTFPHMAAIQTVMELPGLRTLANAAKKENGGALERYIIDGEPAPVFRNPILLTAMLRIILTDLDLEVLFTAIRRLCLHAILHETTDYYNTLFGNFSDFIAALASQCFNNEYVYIVSDSEHEELALLTTKLNALCPGSTAADTTFEHMLMVFGMYNPLYMLDGINSLLTDNTKLPEYLNKVITQQVREPAREALLCREIESITDIKDEISRKVGQQYDEAPFPRWLDIPLSEPRPYRNVLQFTLRDTCPVSITDERIKILVAGCGTGAHAIGTAAQYSDADVLAIDISINCLAYAKRKADEMGVKNVTFKHADILELGGFSECFHIIEVVGVLQTMNEPNEALRILTGLLHPQGFIKIGLYSKKARRHISEASTDFKRRGLTSRDDDVRRLRQEIIALDHASPIRKTAVHLKDFYTMSECRNMYFLVHEVEHDIRDIEEMLSYAGLEFLLFSSPNNTADACFEKVFPDKADKSRLGAWNTVEERYPDTFINMYNLWCRLKPGQ